MDNRLVACGDGNQLDIVPHLTYVFQRLIGHNDKIPFNRSEKTIFHGLCTPAINVHDYLKRIVKYSYCSKECFVLALIYIDRLLQANRKFRITSLNVHRLLITAVMTAAKFFDDAFCTNSYYAKVGGVPVAEVNKLEIKFLFMINFSLFVTPDVFHRYRNDLLAFGVPPTVRLHPHPHYGTLIEADSRMVTAGAMCVVPSTPSPVQSPTPSEGVPASPEVPMPVPVPVPGAETGKAPVAYCPRMHGTYFPVDVY